jgi:3-hydroxyacyl-[acyl-carrier-protein] dehydratase
MNTQAVMRYLPHRYPFLLLDRIGECRPGVVATAYKNVAKNEPFLGGMGAGREMPRLLLLEALAQVAVVLTFRTLGIEPSGSELMFFAGIDHATFSGTVSAGDHVRLEARVLRIMPTKGIGKFATTASVSGRVVATAELIAAIRL